MSAPGEAFWFVVYGIASFLYRLFIMFAISLFIAGKFFFIGVLLAMWTMIVMFAVPLGRAIKYLAANPALHRKRRRALAWSAGLAGAVVVLATLLPVPLSTPAEGLVWVPDGARVLAATEGTIDRLLARPGDEVAVGTPLVRMVDPYLAARVRVLRAQLAELRLRLAAMEVEDRVQAGILREQVRAAAADLELQHQRADDLLIISKVAGRFIVPDGEDVVGRFLGKGELVGYVLDPESPTIRVVVPQENIDLVRQRTRRVGIRFSDRIDAVVPAVISREVPAASRDLPGAALSSLGGGKIAIDPRESRTMKSLDTTFQLDLRLAEPLGKDLVRGRVYVRFDHGSEAVVFRAYRSLRQLFLRHFNV